MTEARGVARRAPRAIASASMSSARVLRCGPQRARVARTVARQPEADAVDDLRVDGQDAPDRRATTRGTRPSSGTSLIHDTDVGQSVLGSCQRPDPVSAASASNGSASRRRTRPPTPGASRTATGACRRAARSRRARPRSRRPARRERARLPVRAPARWPRSGSAPTRARTTPTPAPTHVSPTSNRDPLAITSGTAAVTSRPSVNQPAGAGPTSKRSDIAERDRGVNGETERRRVGPEQRRKPRQEQQHGSRSTPSSARPTVLQDRPVAPRERHRDDEHQRDEHREQDRRRPDRPRDRAEHADDHDGVHRGAPRDHALGARTPRRSASAVEVTRTSAWNTNGAEREAHERTELAARDRVASDRVHRVRGRGDDRRQQRARERAHRAGRRPKRRAATRPTTTTVRASADVAEQHRRERRHHRERRAWPARGCRPSCSATAT